MRRIFKIMALALVFAVTACSADAQENTREAPSDKVTVILGDSNIWLAGDSCDNHQGWMAWLRDIRQLPDCLSYARSGASWSHTSDTKVNTEENIAILGDNNVIYNQVLRLIQAVRDGRQQAPTLLMISSGGNDAWFAHKRPHEFDLTVDDAFVMSDSALIALPPHQVLSLPQAIRYDCLQLRRAFPRTTIVLLTPMQMGKVEPDMLLRVSEIIDETGSRLGIPVIRLDGDEPISREAELTRHVNTYDGIHTSKEGARKVAEFVSARLDSILAAPVSNKPESTKTTH